MTTTASTLGELLRSKRNGGAKAPIYKHLGVPANMYDYWEGSVYLPQKTEHIESLADYLGIDEDSLALDIYHERKRKEAKGVYLSSFSHSLTQPLVAA